MKPNRSIHLLLVVAMAMSWGQCLAESLPRNLLVSVRIDSDSQQAGQGIAVGSPTGRLQARVYGSGQSGSRSSVQQVGVIEGGRASLNVGQSILLPLHQIQVGPNGTFVSESVVLRDLATGFTVSPRVSGRQVRVEISLHQDLPTADPLATRTDRLATTVSGPLGQWLHVGGSSQQVGGQQTGVISYGTHAGSSARQMWLKVDLAP